MEVYPLPQTLELIASLIGEELALKLAVKKGGQRVYFAGAGNMDGSHWLVRLLGEEAANILGKHFKGESVVIPQGPVGTLKQVQTFMQRRRAEALAKGLSANQVAAVSGYSIRQIYRARAQQRDFLASGQKDLFISDDEDTL